MSSKIEHREDSLGALARQRGLGPIRFVYIVMASVLGFVGVLAILGGLWWMLAVSASMFLGLWFWRWPWVVATLVVGVGTYSLTWTSTFGNAIDLHTTREAVSLANLAALRIAALAGPIAGGVVFLASVLRQRWARRVAESA